METAILVAQLLSIVYIFVGLGMLISGDYYSRAFIDMFRDDDNAGIMYIGGAMAAVVGLLIIRSHNIWEASWVVIVTIIGWIALLKGFVLLVFPGRLDDMFGKWFSKGSMKIWGSIILILGLGLGYFGFLA